MRLFELQEEIELTKSDKRSYERKIRRLRESLEPKATDITKEKVDGGSTGKTWDDVMHLIVEAERGLQRCNNILDELFQEVREKERIYHAYNDRDKQIYIDKRLYKLNTAQMEIKYGIGKRAINKIIKKIEKNSKSSP